MQADRRIEVVCEVDDRLFERLARDRVGRRFVGVDPDVCAERGLARRGEPLDPDVARRNRKPAEVDRCFYCHCELLNYYEETLVIRADATQRIVAPAPPVTVMSILSVTSFAVTAIVHATPLSLMIASVVVPTRAVVPALL